ncbi:hypothetical protein [Maribacter sp. 2210JD10-5]|uniref:hypothetical protein n=1 Tax=Maribacter sp. 2210JD10-5 TaxID=3386272 RepID=UPI0039BC9823
MMAMLALMTLSNVFANDLDKAVKPKTELSKQIYTLLEDNPFTVEDELVANVRLTFNQAGEIVVLSIEGTNASITSFVKSRLNYTKVDFAGKVEGRVYTLPVKVVAS